jgi:RND family efflux transporter MFP subunit
MMAMATLRQMVLLSACVCPLVGCERSAPPPEVVRPARVIRVGDVRTVISPKFPGRTKATREVDLSFRVDGTLHYLPILVGDEVTAGQVVARLDPRDFEVRVRSAQATLGQAAAALALAREEHMRAREAHEMGAASDIELTQKREAENGAVARVAAAEAALEEARNDLEYSELVAPFEGTVAARYLDNFEDVQAKQPVLRILDDSRIEMMVDIPEQIVALSPQVQEVRCTFDAFAGTELTATIKERGNEADPITRTYPVTLIMDQPPGIRVLPGMTGQAWAIYGQTDEGDERGFEIPLEGVGEDAGGERFVWVVNETDGKVARRPVEVMELTQAGVLVRGLQQGELIATAGAAFLHEGQRVRPQITVFGVLTK